MWWRSFLAILRVAQTGGPLIVRLSLPNHSDDVGARGEEVQIDHNAGISVEALVEPEQTIPSLIQLLQSTVIVSSAKALRKEF
jgi:hypothetical protein